MKEARIDMNPERPEHRSEKRSLGAAILAGAPTLLVLAGIAAVGAWGHRTGWKAPKFSSIDGSAATASAEDWCKEHNVPDSKCIACNPELVGESAADWCKEHGVAESQCTICHPEILSTGVAGDWCKEHGLPESGCTLCHPEIARKGELPADGDLVSVTNGAPAGENADEHLVAAGPPAQTARDPRTCQTHALKVQFATAASVEKAGVRLGTVSERRVSDSVLAIAEVDYARTRFFKLASRVAGTARHVSSEQGAHVRTGDALAVIDSAEIGHAKAEYLQAAASL